MPGSKKQNSMFKKTRGYVQQGNPFAVTSCGRRRNDGSPLAKTAAWTRKEGKNPKGGLNQKGVDSYKRENPGSKLQTAVTTKPSKLKKGSKAAKRRKSFCARMGGMPGPMMRDGKPTRKKLALDKWNC